MTGRPGERRAEPRAAAQATIQFYGQILAAKVSVFTRPDQLLQLRHVLKARDLGPHNAYVAVANYLDRERALGRVAATSTAPPRRSC